jgi:hypothetical protein
MNNFKNLIALMFYLGAVQLSGASEDLAPRRRISFTSEGATEIPADAARSRSSSAGLIEQISIASSKKSALPSIQLAETISLFQRSDCIGGIRRGHKNLQEPRSIARYVAALECADRLAESRKSLEKLVDASCPIEIIQSIQENIAAYRSHPSKIDVVVASTSFLNIERKCQEILSASRP